MPKKSKFKYEERLLESNVDLEFQVLIATLPESDVGLEVFTPHKVEVCGSLVELSSVYIAFHCGKEVFTWVFTHLLEFRSFQILCNEMEIGEERTRTNPSSLLVKEDDKEITVVCSPYEIGAEAFDRFGNKVLCFIFSDASQEKICAIYLSSIFLEGFQKPNFCWTK